MQQMILVGGRKEGIEITWRSRDLQRNDEGEERERDSVLERENEKH